MKVEHVLIDGVVHRMVSSSAGMVTVSCDLPYFDGDQDMYERCEAPIVDAPITCVMCLVLDWRAAFFTLVGTRTGRMSSKGRPR